MTEYKGEEGIAYRASYAWISYPAGFSKEIPSDDKILCAWCKKSRSEIKKTEDPNDHIENHNK